MLSNKAKRSREGGRDVSKLIGFGIRPLAACTVPIGGSFGIVGVLIITSYLREHKHHPAVKTPHMRIRYDTKSPKYMERRTEKGFPRSENRTASRAG